MKKIGLLSDTHSFLNNKLFKFFENCDEIWHCGDIGDIKVLNELENFKPVRAVYGNIDGYEIRYKLSENLHFEYEGMKVWLTHIGGYPGRYDKRVYRKIHSTPPDLFICGHSHILKVIYDKNLKLLHINPGAAGNYGQQKVPTAIRFNIHNGRVEDLEIIELK